MCEKSSLPSDWKLTNPIHTGLVPFDWIVDCDICGVEFDTCGKRPEGRKFLVEVDGEKTYLCIECQDATGVEPKYDPRYAS